MGTKAIIGLLIIGAITVGYAQTSDGILVFNQTRSQKLFFNANFSEIGVDDNGFTKWDMENPVSLGYTLRSLPGSQKLRISFDKVIPVEVAAIDPNTQELHMNQTKKLFVQKLFKGDDAFYLRKDPSENYVFIFKPESKNDTLFSVLGHVKLASADMTQF